LEDLDTEVEIDSVWETIREIIKIADKESTAEPLVPGPSRLEVEIAIAKFEKYKSPGCDEIPAELLQAGGEIFLCGERYQCAIPLPHFGDPDVISVAQKTHFVGLMMIPYLCSRLKRARRCRSHSSFEWE
jgi:hypothetical protein